MSIFKGRTKGQSKVVKGGVSSFHTKLSFMNVDLSSVPCPHLFLLTLRAFLSFHRKFFLPSRIIGVWWGSYLGETQFFLFAGETQSLGSVSLKET